jgi:hypothetical protein
MEIRGSPVGVWCRALAEANGQYCGESSASMQTGKHKTQELRPGTMLIAE